VIEITIGLKKHVSDFLQSSGFHACPIVRYGRRLRSGSFFDDNAYAGASNAHIAAIPEIRKSQGGKHAGVVEDPG